MYNELDYIKRKTLQYRNLVYECRRYGYKFQKGKKERKDDLELYLLKNMNKIEPIDLPYPDKPNYNYSKTKKRNYSLEYYHTILELCTERGFYGHLKLGRVSFEEMFDFLDSEGVDYEKKEKIVIHQKRRSLEECKTDYQKLLFRAKSFGYKQGRLGRPSQKTLEEFLSTHKDEF